MIKNFFKIPPAYQLNIIFFTAMAILIVVFYSKIPNSINFLLIYFSMVVFQFFIYRFDNNSFMNYLKKIGFPVFSVLLAFDTIGEITPYINRDIDYALLNIDYKILRFYPYVYLEKFANPYLTELMQISYCVYYPLPFLLGTYLIKKGKKEEFHRALFLVLLCFYLSYIGYISFPALGPRYSIPQMFNTELTGVLLSDKIKDFLNLLEGIKRDAFPSGHVGVSVLILYLFYKYDKRIFLLIFLPVMLMITSTIYCRYHYFIDIIAGLILTVVTLLLGNLYYNFWLSKNGTSHLQR